MLAVDTIYNMDCLAGMKEIDDESIDLILTDPPYGINFVPQRQGSKERLGDKPIENDDKIGDDWVEWFMPICKDAYRVLKDDSVAYFFSGFNPYYYYYYCLLECGFTIKANIIWVKDNFGLGYHFRRQYEQILVAFKGEPPTPAKAMSDVIFDKKVNGFALLHSCQKPENLCRILLKQYTREGDLVLDPFMGSGTTAVACKQEQRRFIGFEINPKHYSTCLDRLNQNTLFNYNVLEGALCRE